MFVFRLSRKKYTDPLSGYGAYVYGGRWNSAGISTVYTSESRAMAMAELMVHTSAGRVPNDLQISTIEIADSLEIEKTNESLLPFNWQTFPPLLSTQAIGDRFVRSQEYAVLRVPSSVVAGGYNYLLNPQHKDFKKIKVRKTDDFALHRRLFT